jgi:hypothetical protein
MQEPYEEGVASHLDPESCAGGREAGRNTYAALKAKWWPREADDTGGGR